MGHVTLCHRHADMTKNRTDAHSIEPVSSPPSVFSSVGRISGYHPDGRGFESHYFRQKQKGALCAFFFNQPYTVCLVKL